ncbi:DEAD/DEAH box helicase family protein [Corallococcus llansteffanensis]|nr:DEAD/DEAH box helicase family protein [Corallococcus llansteffanensis]
MSVDWDRVAARLEELAREHATGRGNKGRTLREDQRATLSFVATRLPRHGLIVADEVGTGKTTIACAVIKAVLAEGGRAAVLVPRGLIHQWRAEYRALFPDAQGPRELTTLPQWLEEDESPSPTDGPEWWLISHGFRYPRVTHRSHGSKIAFPSLVRLFLEPPNIVADGRTSVGHISNHARKHAKDHAWWRNLLRMAERVAPLVHDRQPLLQRLEALPLLKPEKDNRELCESLCQGKEAHSVVSELLGLWLGRFDLIVIDEAHKSREETFEDGEEKSTRRAWKQLPSLLQMLGQGHRSRRICLTATPMELAPHDWGDLLARAQIHAPRGPILRAIDALHRCLKAAKSTPDQPSTIKDLISAAECFQQQLEPFVTRRRLLDQAQLEDLRAHRPEARELAHPHRRTERHLVPLKRLAAGQSDAWRPMLTALEGYSHAARGLDESIVGTRAKVLYTKLANGLVSADELEDDDWLQSTPSPVDPRTAAKLERLAYWRKKFRDSRQELNRSALESGITGYHPDSEHPRILSVVEAIEAWTGLKESEKVLVFGVFTLPMRRLRDVLNARHCVRSLDGGAPIAFSLHEDEPLLAVAFRNMESMQREKSLTGRLAGKTWTLAEFKRLALEAHSRYRKIRDDISRHVRKHTDALVQERFAMLGANDRERLREIIRTLLLDDWLVGGRSDPPSEELLGTLITRIWHDHVEPAIATDSDVEEGEHDESKYKQFVEWIDLEWNEVQGRQTGFCRLMNGDTKWPTRRSLQAGFNRQSGCPQVLIAQSQVGREGLNLHLACRVVVQFHAEWNPASLEQQVGRVDRLNSRWWHMYDQWKRSAMSGPMPLIEVRQVMLEGTYDAFQWDLVRQRQHTFDATLFGSLLPATSWQSVPESLRAELRAAAPNFDPRRPRES